MHIQKGEIGSFLNQETCTERDSAGHCGSLSPEMKMPDDTILIFAMFYLLYLSDGYEEGIVIFTGVVWAVHLYINLE